MPNSPSESAEKRGLWCKTPHFSSFIKFLTWKHSTLSSKSIFLHRCCRWKVHLTSSKLFQLFVGIRKRLLSKANHQTCSQHKNECLYLYSLWSLQSLSSFLRIFLRYFCTSLNRCSLWIVTILHGLGVHSLRPAGGLDLRALRSWRHAFSLAEALQRKTKRIWIWKQKRNWNIWNNTKCKTNCKLLWK